MTQSEANSLSNKNYDMKDMKLLDYTQTRDGQTLWKFVWPDKNGRNQLEVHYHREPDTSTGCNVRWYTNPQDWRSVNPAPQWISVAALWAAASMQYNIPSNSIVV